MNVPVYATMEIIPETKEVESVNDEEWYYNSYRSTLIRDGKTFAIVTPDGKNPLEESDIKLLLEALNKSTCKHSRVEHLGSNGWKCTACGAALIL